MRHLLVALALVVSACADATHDAPEAAPERDVAVAVCQHLVSFVNREVRVVNRVAEAVTEATEPDVRLSVLLDGWEQIVALAHDHVRRTAELRLPGGADAPVLQSELQAGAVAAAATLESRQLDLVELGPFDEASERSIIGMAFMGLEKAFALTEPAVFRYENRALREAFDDEPLCDHVVQWTGT